MTPADRIGHQVNRIIQLAGLSQQEISERYFSNFHKWLPIISPRLFRETVTAYDRGLGHPPLDVSVLLLAMCLVTFQPATDSSLTPIAPQGLYGTAKMVFAEAQSIICASSRLLQTGLLIAAYEYANGRPEAAHITMGTCTRIGYVDGLQDSDLAPTDLKARQPSSSVELERFNLWWGVIILERFVLCEVKGSQQRPATEYPSPGALLPTDLDIDEENSHYRLNIQRAGLCMPDERMSSNGNFGRQAEAGFLLDQVLAVRRLPQGDRSRISEFQRLDEHLQGFLTILMSTDTAQIGRDCSGIAPAVRALFLIHQEILQYPPETVDLQWLRYSQSVLGTVANVVVDVARHHKEQIACQNAHADLLPLSCSYTLHLAMKYIQGCMEISGSTERSKDLDYLAELDHEFSNRWNPGSHHERA
ncbi:hypothetical protein BO71DRAFT_427186 [Aspergillus ellipticus CBS 707.79]|uniref:Transcription factor domain-containing protein n=1 Tax=Aspergillus ellipticus CBS 707.79 TaxID=1448320 RepID=A0A319DIU1_9EURO|nr:hypothetical protein BO71DRAFT_427186 [Aspergillus ellipticus CBS 707.79]